MNWRAVWAIARKDIVDAVKNQYLLFGLLLPIGLSLLFGVVFPAPDRIGALTIAVYDPGGSQLVAGLGASSQAKLIPVASADALRGEVERSAVGGLLLPAGFDAAVQAGQQPELTVYLNNRRGGGELAAFQRLIDQQVWTLVGQAPPAKVVWTNAAAEALSGSEGLDLRRYMLIQFLLLSLAMTGTFVVPTLLVEEREKHTLAALLVSPAGAPEVTLGKAVAGSVFCLVLGVVMITLNAGWGVQWPVMLLALLLGTLLMVALGLLLGGLLRTTMQVNTWSTIVLMALILPSLVTAVQMPAMLETAFRAIPSHYLVDLMVLAATNQATPAKLALDAAVLAVCAAAVMGGVVWTLRREST